MTDGAPGSDSDAEPERVTAAEIESYLVCPRRYEFEHERAIAPRESHRDLVRERRRRLLRDAVVAGLRAETDDERERERAALDRLDERWDASGSGYLVDEQAAYDRSVAEAAIEAYFAETGHDHAANLLAADATLSHELDDVRYEVSVDAVVEADGEYLALRYVPDLSGILNVGWYDDNVESYRDGSEFFPRQIASFARAGLAIRSLRREHGLDARVDFAYVGLIEESRPGYEPGSEVTVRPEIRRFSGQYENEERDLARLLERTATDVLESATDPSGPRFDDILDASCSYCAYRDACPDRVRAEVSFTDRTDDDPAVEAAMRADASADGDAR